MGVTRPLAIEAMATTEDEFEGRDGQGLQPVESGKKPEDARAEAEAKYFKMIFGVVPVIQLVLASATYAAMYYMLGFSQTLDSKFAFLRAHDLGWIYLAVAIIAFGRARLVINANANRAGARVDRPDQHVFRTMDSKAAADAPYVLMANTGDAGRFNRAQRGVFNTDESMPAFLVNTVLAGAVFGPVVVLVALAAVYGRVKFGLGYTEGVKGRLGGFLPAMVAEGLMAGLTLFIGLKTVFMP